MNLSTISSITSLLAVASLAGSAHSQTTINYWDFESTADVVGGVPTAMSGAPDMSVHGLYGEAYTGAGKSLNIVFGSSDYLVADVHDGTNATALDLGTSDFSFSYWAYDAFAVDADAKGPRILDFLDGTSTGLQLGTNASNIYNFRVDDDQGGTTLSNTTLSISMPTDAWVHVAVNVDRTGGVMEIFFNGASQGTATLTNSVTGGIRPTRDMDIGTINSDGTQSQTQESGLDDLAFYDGLLSAADITGLAAGVLTPASFAPSSGNGYCFGDGSATACPCGNVSGAGEGCANSGGTGATLTENGTVSIGADDLGFDCSGLLPSQPALLFVGDNALNASNGVIFGDGLRCAGGSVIRLGTQTPDAGGMASWSTTAAGGGWISGDTRYFQAWYRDPISGPCGSGFNLSNGVGLTFVN